MEIAKIAYLLMIHIVCVWTDYKEKKIKNGCILAIMGGAVIFHILTGDSQVVAEALVAMIIFFAGLFPLYCIRTLGAGDVKLFSATALYIGNVGLDEFLIGVLASAGILSFVKLLYYGAFLKRIRYLILYMKNVIVTGEITSYGMPRKDAETLRLALPALIGTICWGIGGS